MQGAFFTGADYHVAPPRAMQQQRLLLCNKRAAKGKVQIEKINCF